MNLTIQNTISRIRSFFRKTNLQITDLRKGDFVEICFRDPRKMGLLDPSNQLTKRYDPDDLESLMLAGTITNLFSVNGMRLLEMVSTKIGLTGQPRTRSYTLMEDDIESIRRLNTHD